jgi:nitroreductase
MIGVKDRIRKLMPRGWWSFLHRTRGTLRNSQALAFGKSPLAARVYYTFSTKFGREMKAVMAGRAAMLPIGGPGYEYRLRRSIHRIEKGLISRPRRANFAISYIADTVVMLDAYLGGVENANEDLLAVWATGVLTEYFSVSAPHPIVDKARQRFEPLAWPRHPCVEQSTPYVRVVSPPPVRYSDFLELSHRRRSVRWYSDNPVPRELVDQAIEAAAQSPSACNRQPFMFKVFDDEKLVQQIAHVPGGAAGFAQGFTGIIVVVGDLSAFGSERDRHLIYIDSSLAAMAFMLGAETLGFSTCPLNWPDVPETERELQRIMKLEPYERPVMLIAYGYPDPEGLVASSLKRPLSELRTYNEVG